MKPDALGGVIRALALSTLILAVSSSVSRAAIEQPIVGTDSGPVRGITTATYRAFLGIPYAAPPIGQLRWHGPEPHARWTGPRDASHLGSPCPQIALGTGQLVGAEDCLFLNVYTPSTEDDDLPVMVWIHGAGFVRGQGGNVAAGPLAARADAIVVTLNYRLGPLGFLAFAGPTGATGDYGLQDQQRALRWIASNIARFGGNPRNVTIFGQSAGGISVCDQLVSPTAMGLFHRAIIQSGSCTHPLSQLDFGTAQGFGAAFAGSLGCHDLACLRDKPISALLDPARPSEMTATGPGWTPSYGGGTLLPSRPAQLLQNGQFNRVPVINGTNHDEGRFYALLLDVAGTPLTAVSYTALVQQVFGPAASAVLATYPLSNYATPSLAYAAVVTDAALACPARTADRLLSSAPVRTYAYEFNDENAPPLVPPGVSRAAFLAGIAPFFPAGLGAYHGAEIAYVFQAPVQFQAFPAVIDPSLDFTDDQFALSDRMIGYWSRFSRRGDPNRPDAPAWLPYSSSGDSFLSLQESGPEMINGFAADHKCTFWSAFGI